MCAFICVALFVWVGITFLPLYSLASVLCTCITMYMYSMYTCKRLPDLFEEREVLFFVLISLSQNSGHLQLGQSQTLLLLHHTSHITPSPSPSSYITHHTLPITLLLYKSCMVQSQGSDECLTGLAACVSVF